MNIKTQLIVALMLPLLLSPLSTIGQTNGVNCVIFINGKLPYISVSTGYFSYQDSTNQKQTVPFDYTIGELNIEPVHASQLFSLPFDHLIEVTVIHNDFQGNRKPYTATIMAGWLKNNYIIFRITTFKKGKYYFGISIPALSSEFIKGEYYIFESYDN